MDLPGEISLESLLMHLTNALEPLGEIKRDDDQKLIQQSKTFTEKIFQSQKQQPVTFTPHEHSLIALKSLHQQLTHWTEEKKVPEREKFIFQGNRMILKEVKQALHVLEEKPLNMRNHEFPEVYKILARLKPLIDEVIEMVAQESSEMPIAMKKTDPEPTKEMEKRVERDKFRPEPKEKIEGKIKVPERTKVAEKLGFQKAASTFVEEKKRIHLETRVVNKETLKEPHKNAHVEKAIASPFPYLIALRHNLLQSQKKKKRKGLWLKERDHRDEETLDNS